MDEDDDIGYDGLDSVDDSSSGLSSTLLASTESAFGTLLNTATGVAQENISALAPPTPYATTTYIPSSSGMSSTMILILIAAFVGVLFLFSRR